MAKRQGSIRIRRTKDALIDVDIQNAFMPGGGLPVPDGDGIVPTVKIVHRHFVREQRFMTLDQHPRGHISLASSYAGLAPFAALALADVRDWTEDRLAPGAKFTLDQLKAYLAKVGTQVLWPDHALIGTRDLDFCRKLDHLDYIYAQTKGRDPACDSYSGFRDNLRRPTGLAAEIRRRLPECERVFLTGLAYDYCVGWTALDAVEEGFEAVVVKDATRAIDQGGSVAAIEQAFADKGVRVVMARELGPSV
jgi:nicotinamidase/pyrazinamidase